MWMKDYFWYCTTCQKGVRAHTHTPTHTTCTSVCSLIWSTFYRVCIQFDSWEILQLTQSRAFSHDCADPTWLCFTFDFVQEECSLSLSPCHQLSSPYAIPNCDSPRCLSSRLYWNESPRSAALAAGTSWSISLPPSPGENQHHWLCYCDVSILSCQ